MIINFFMVYEKHKIIRFMNKNKNFIYSVNECNFEVIHRPTLPIQNEPGLNALLVKTTYPKRARS